MDQQAGGADWYRRCGHCSRLDRKRAFPTREQAEDAMDWMCLECGDDVFAAEKYFPLGTF